MALQPDCEEDRLITLTGAFYRQSARRRPKSRSGFTVSRSMCTSNSPGAGAWTSNALGEVFHQRAPDAVLPVTGADDGH
jgi:hypothetical protein